MLTLATLQQVEESKQELLRLCASYLSRKLHRTSFRHVINELCTLVIRCGAPKNHSGVLPLMEKSWICEAGCSHELSVGITSQGTLFCEENGEWKESERMEWTVEQFIRLAEEHRACHRIVKEIRDNIDDIVIGMLNNVQPIASA